MKLIQTCFTSGLLIILLATAAQSQTIFSGDEYNGVGVQAGITSINDRPAQIYAVGLSLNRKADLTLSFLNAEYPVNRDNIYSSTTVLLQLAFFPTLEKNGDTFTTEVAGGFGGGGIADAPIISFGLGVSKAVIGELDKNNIRPRASFGYSILTSTGENVNEPPFINSHKKRVFLEHNSMIIIILEVKTQPKTPMNKSTNFPATKTSHSEFSPTLFNLSDVDKKKVDVRFSGEQTSHDGGLLLLREVEQQVGLIGRLADSMKDNRHQGYVQHSVTSMLSQRIFQIAAGYEDANDCDSMKNDGILKLCGEGHQALSSQPTMCRFENAVSPSELFNMARVFVDTFIASYPGPPNVIILDCDDTSALTYGQQELTLFNTYYGDHCYMPLHIYEGLSGKLVASILKPGRRSKSIDVFCLLQRIIGYLMTRWPDTVIILRGDSHFCSKEFMDWSETIDTVDFLTGLSGNQKLNELIKDVKESAERRFADHGRPVKRYHSFLYQAGSWGQPHRVVAKVEVSHMGTNVRFIASSLRNVKAKELYEKGYCARGAAELRIKDHKAYLASDRMSCSSFKANQFRLFLHSAAYVLIHTLQQDVLVGTQYAKATMKTIQLKLIKVAARVKVLKTKVTVELPVEFATRWIFEKCFGIFQALRIFLAHRFTSIY